jgi:hypothetical protein
MEKASVVREIRELKNQLSYSKNTGFFFGAGTSCALSIPNIEQLTAQVKAALKSPADAHFGIVENDLVPVLKPRKTNIEDILNQIRRLRELTNDSDKKYEGLSGKEAKALDKAICVQIYNILIATEQKADLKQTKRFFAWLSILNPTFSKEVFTTNYDLVIERSLESGHIPYFDGFVGSYEPFFWQDSIDRITQPNDITHGWVRLWKIHGSLNWFWKEDPVNKTSTVVRLGKIDKIENEPNELVIYPSRDKYVSSRKQPFIAYFDRLKNYLLQGELLFIVTGYSFSDQHINEIIFNCLRNNNRLSILVFLFKDSEVTSLHTRIASYMNITVLGPTKAILNGNLCEWEFQVSDFKNTEEPFDHYWDDGAKQLKLGDFNHLVDFLIKNSGRADAIDNIGK